MHLPQTGMRNRGFTLIELMIVVTIIGVLAVIAIGQFKRAGSRARAAEVYGMLGEIRSKEEAYRAEYSVYCTTESTTCASVATTATENNYFPALLPFGEPVAKPIVAPAALPPAAWVALGLNPGKSALYCGYVATAGCGSSTTGCGGFTAGVNGSNLFNNTQPTGAWWYATATCNMDGKSGGAAKDTIFVTGVNTAAVVVLNEGS